MGEEDVPTAEEDLEGASTEEDLEEAPSAEENLQGASMEEDLEDAPTAEELSLCGGSLCL